MLISTHSPTTHQWTQPPTDTDLPTQKVLIDNDVDDEMRVNELERPELREWETGVKRVRYRRPKLREWETRVERVSLREMSFRDEEMRWEWMRERESDGMYYFNHRGIKIIFFLFSSHEQCPSIYRCAL